MSMSVPTALSPPLPPAPREPVETPADAFLRTRHARLEERLAEECDAIGRGLGPLSEALTRAIGTRGRGGSRWRPLLTMASAEALGGSRDGALDVAVAVELTHTASLALDDLPCMDDSELRRGVPSTHRLVGSAGAILLSVGLLARTAELLGRQPRCGGLLARDWGRSFGLRGMAGGQAMDVGASGRLVGAARRLHREKSTALPAFALGAGAHLAAADEATQLGLEAFGRAVGWSYQLLDDLEDVQEDTSLGRPSLAPTAFGLSRRILRMAIRRLRGLPGLDAQGAQLLVTLACRVVRVPGACDAGLASARPAGRS